METEAEVRAPGDSSNIKNLGRGKRTDWQKGKREKAVSKIRENQKHHGSQVKEGCQQQGCHCDLDKEISAGCGGENLPGMVPRKTAKERKSRQRV